MRRSDSDYIEQCLDGHPEAYRYLFRRYQPVVVAKLAGRLGSLELAEEIAQEAFVRAFVKLRSLRRRQSFLAWLLGIADRVVKEEKRKEHRKCVQAREYSYHRGAAGASPSNDTELEHAIGSLPDIYREVILLRYYGRCDCEAIAERLQIATGSVRSRLSRAYRLLQGSLDQHGPADEGSEVRR